MSGFAIPTVAAAAQEGGGEPLPFLIIGIWILLLAVFVGFELITKVPPTIHTPLMSGANAISGITIVGALYCAGTGYGGLGQFFGFLAITMATVNCVGGFLVTDRMLKMFGQRGKKS
ncbi:MAG: NAD(P) transhydrogenase subunit alpha [Planctomycetota bacterium]